MMVLSQAREGRDEGGKSKEDENFSCAADFYEDQKSTRQNGDRSTEYMGQEAGQLVFSSSPSSSSSSSSSSSAQLLSGDYLSSHGVLLPVLPLLLQTRISATASALAGRRMG